MPELKKFPSRKSWLEARRGGLGGSDSAAIVGVDPYRSALQVYAEKTDLIEPQEDNNILWWGRKLQPIVAQAYRRETGRKLQYYGNHFFVSEERMSDRDREAPQVARPVVEPRGRAGNGKAFQQ